jgi:hypothetical protein
MKDINIGRSFCWLAAAMIIIAALFCIPCRAGVPEYWATIKVDSTQTWMKAKVFTALVLQPGVSAWNTRISTGPAGVKLTGVASSEAQAQLTELVAMRYSENVRSDIKAPGTTAVTSGFSDMKISAKVVWAVSCRPLANTIIKVSTVNGCVALPASPAPRPKASSRRRWLEQSQTSSTSPISCAHWAPEYCASHPVLRHRPLYEIQALDSSPCAAFCGLHNRGHSVAG